MNRLNLALITAVIMTVIVVTVAAVAQSSIPQAQQELDFTVSGTNDCLRFLDRHVQTGYTPFKTGANEQWQLTINCTEMPSPNAWTDLYIYEDYWDKGANNTCVSEDLYPIISEIQPSEFRIKANSTFSETFGGASPKSYTLFFVFPVGGTGTFHITLKQVN